MNTKEAITYWNEKLSETVREEISDDYDNKSINLDDIVNKYKLPFDKSKLPALVLPKQTDVKCKWCGEVLFIKRRRSTSKYYTNYEYCINCGHINNASCTCSKCVEMRARQEKQKRRDG